VNCASIPFGLLICFLCCQVVIAAPPAAPDFIGTYHLESMTKHGQIVPTNFAGITIILNANGSFAATNVPVDFFFDDPTNSFPIARGTWDVKQADGTAALFLNFATPTGSNACLMLVKSDFGTVRISKLYHPGKRDSAEIYLGKQKAANGSTNSTP
jgi:hypothetical protein